MSDEIHISNNRSEVYNLLRGKNADEYNSTVTKLCEELAFHSSRGGVKLVPKMGWCIIKYSNVSKPSYKLFSAKEDALKHLNEHHATNRYPLFDEIDKTLQDILCFESPIEFVAQGKYSETEFGKLNSEEQRAEIAKQMTKNMKRKLDEFRTETAEYTVPIKNHSTLDSLERAYSTALTQRLNDYAAAVKNSIENPFSFSLKEKHALKAIPHKKPHSWVDIETDPGASFLNALRTILLDTKMANIAEVLAYSHPILEVEYVSESVVGTPRKPINDNDVHGVFTTSKVKDVIETMARKGFDNQPVYCKDSGRCIGSIRLREAMKNLYLGRYSNHPTFQNYQEMIKENLMLLPPPMFSPSDSVEYVVSIFNSGCEAVLFEFDKETWLQYGGAPEVTKVLENGLHILTPHDVVIYFLKTDSSR